MSITAAGADSAPVGSDIRQNAVAVYEAAADASVLAGNLGFYCTCLSRLLKDFYPPLARASTPAPRHTELLGASLLYYGIFASAPLEVACHLRELPPGDAAAPPVRFALRAAALAARGQYWGFSRLYADEDTTRRQRTVMQPALVELRKRWIRVIAKAYLSLDERTCADWLGFGNGQEGEARRLLVETVPGLASVNEHCASGALQFRQRR